MSVVFLAYNRRRELLRSLHQTLNESGYPASALEVLVVDNASADGTAEAVAEAFPDVRVVRNEDNLGAPGWNAGFALARGKYVLILDDDAYLPPGDLERAVRAAESEHAGLVSFSVVSSFELERRLNDDWPTGLLSYWGCAALVSREALGELGGYDPNIFIWANEVDLTMRLLDRGYRHLHLPEVYRDPHEGADRRRSSPAAISSTPSTTATSPASCCGPATPSSRCSTSPKRRRSTRSRSSGWRSAPSRRCSPGSG